ncbi:hypothetical protein MAHJHV58_04430 [Mycobacterium avium subsp. hominissuis]|uniref:hypothetical protein n=1 Tax=Mycobacterium avium TaxID=1764 RepID=UPI00111BD928|nr:hypothetical protein [Mycobacterium avium]MCA4720890.1 hypothetical protein [Mycobacterium avium subsp. hominissuis]MCA4736680.1 hypothetical protein [Mycobacterium avium subsp. hominissuis]MCA4745903.1 hypothetical protein [Mycobacterium avium subsp. hominissuis]
MEGAAMSLAVFEDAARAHFSNPPSTWQVLPHPEYGGWQLVDRHGAIIDRCRTKAQAERRRHSGPDAQRWYQRTDWYLGYDAGGRTLTGPEQLIVDDLTRPILDAAHAFHRATDSRRVRYIDQAADDDRIWDAVELPNGRYQVRGDYFHTYTAAALEFLDDQAAAATTDLTAFLRDLLDTDRMRYAV